MTQAEFAKASGISRRSIVRYEKATSLAEVKRSARLAWSASTGVPIEWLEHGGPANTGLAGRKRFVPHNLLASA